MKKIRRFRPDNGLLEKAMLKAKASGLPIDNMRQLIRYLIAHVNSGIIPLSFEMPTFDFGDWTTFSYNEKVMKSLKEKIEIMGYTPTNDFVVNLMFHIYINS